MAESYELDPVDWITAGAIGRPGARTFYLQARQGGEHVALVLEKGQVAQLAAAAQQLLSRVGHTVTPDDLDAAGQALIDGLEPAWRVGELSLGSDEEGERFLIEAAELSGEDEDGDLVGHARFWLDRTTLVAFAAFAAFSVEAGAREACPLCERPIDPVDGHVCPSSNGHGPLTS